MLKYDVERAQRAVQFLVDSPYYKHHIRRLRNVVKRPRALPFSDESETLNELLVIGRQNVQAMENLIAVADHKRHEKTPYMTAFMAAKRAREKKVVEIEETTLGRKLTLDERLALIRRTREQWNAERELHKASCTEQYRTHFGREPNWQQSNQFIKDFWMLKDVKLDVMLREAQQFVSSRKAPKTTFKPKVVRTPRNTIMADRMRDAMKK
jgi:hypothetical protein